MKQKEKRIVILALALLLLVCGGIYTAYRLHPESFVGQDDIITRGEFAAILARDLSLDTSKAEKDPPSFADIDGHWSEKNIEALIDAGIIDPADYPDGFHPDDPITRAEIIKMLVKAEEKNEEAINTQGHSGYQDQADIKDDDKGYVIIGREDGIIGDTDDNKIHPNDPVTKGEAEDLIDKTKPESSIPTPAIPSQTSDTKTPSLAPEAPEQTPQMPTPTNPDENKPSPTPTPSNPGGGSGGGSYYPPAQVRFELPATAHTDSNIQVMPVWKYMKSFTWSLTKTAVDGSQQPVELEDAVSGSLGLEGGTIQFKEDGQYTLTATAKNVRGKETVLSRQITVYPVIDLSFDLPEAIHTDKSVTLTFPLEKLYGHDIVWSATKDGETAELTDILDGNLGNEGGTFVFGNKGEYALTASITDETGRVFTHSESTKVYPVAGISFDLPSASHTDTTLDVSTELTEADGLTVNWSLTKNGEALAFVDAAEGTLTNVGGNIRFKDKGVYTLTGTLTDETSRTFEASDTVTVYPVGSIGFYVPEITHTDKTVHVETRFENLGDATIQWSLTKDGEAVDLTDAVQGELSNDGGYIRFINKGEYVLKAAFTDPAGRSYSYTAPVKAYPVPGITYTLPETAHTDTIVNVVPETSELGSLKVEWLLENGFGFQDFGTYVSGTLDNSGGSIRFKHAGTYELIARITDETGRVFLFENGGKIEVLPVLSISFELPESTHTDHTIDLRTRGNNNMLPVEWTATKNGAPVELSDVAVGSLNAHGGKIRFTQIGDYTLTASMTDALGRVFSYSTSTSVYPIPSILLELPQNWYAGEDGTVSVSGTDLENLTANWTITQGNDGAQPYNLYASGALTKTGGSLNFLTKGQYELTLTMTDPTGRTFIRSRSFTVYPIPSMVLSLPQTWHAEEGGAVGVSGTDLENLTADWTVRKENGEAKPYSDYASGALAKDGGTITFPLKGQYELTLTMTDNNGRAFTESRSFTVYPIPSVSLGIPQPWYAGEAGTVSVSGTDLENLTADWTIRQGSGDAKPYSTYAIGTLVKAGGSVIIPAKGQHEMILTLTDPTGRTFTKSQSFTIYPVPSMALSLPQTWHAGEAGAVGVSGTDLENLTASWTIKQGGSEAKPYSTYASGALTEDGGTITFPSKGQYELILTMTDNNDRDFAESRSFTVYPIPTVSLGVPQPWYAGEAGTVSVNGTDLENLTAAWTVRQGSGDAKPYSTYATGTLTKAGGTITFPAKGQYELTITLTDPTGRTFTKSQSFTISPIPALSISLPTLTYSGDPIAVTASGSELNGSNTAWLISVDGGQPKLYTQYATGTVGTGGGSLTISTDKTIAVKLIAEVTDINGRKFAFTSNTATVKPIASFPFTVPSSVHIGSNISVSLPTTSGLEGRTLAWSLTKGGTSASYTGSLSNSGGTIVINTTGSYTLTASTIDSTGRTFSYSQNITNTVPNKPTGSATVVRTAKDGKLLVNLSASASDPDGDAVTLEYSGNTADSYYPVGTHTVKVRAKDAWGLYSDWTDISFTVANSAPTTPVITRTPDGNSVAPGVPITITATSTDHDGDPITYAWEGRPAQISTAYPLGKNVVRVKAVDSTGAESPWAAIVFFIADPNKGGGMTLSGPESVILEQGIAGATITNYTFTVPPVSGHSGNDYGRVRGYNILTGQWDQLDYSPTTNGITFSRNLSPGIYSQLEFYYYTNHDCMYNKSNITYSVNFYFE
jgi:hypothetical protein